MGLVALWHVGSSRTRARTRVLCIGRWILNHCAIREAHFWIHLDILFLLAWDMIFRLKLQNISYLYRYIDRHRNVTIRNLFSSGNRMTQREKDLYLFLLEQLIKLIVNPMKRQCLQMMFCGVWYLQRIPENNALDAVAVDDTYMVNSLTFTLFHP